MDNSLDNTSGGGASATVPAEIDRWNWGAFLLNWIWGIGNNTFIALLMFVPVVNMVMPFVLGVKGSAWAWRNKRWDSVEHFRRVQRQWSLWGVAIVLLMVLAFGALISSIFIGLKHSDAYQLAVQTVQADAKLEHVLGKPIHSGFPTGNLEVSGGSGNADMSFHVAGPRSKGTVYFTATKHLGQWRITEMAFEEDGSGKRIPLIEGSGEV
jgi:hypothetical protein